MLFISHVTFFTVLNLLHFFEERVAKQLGMYSKVSTSDQDAFEMDDYSGGKEEVEQGDCSCLVAIRSCWSIVTTVNRFYSCFKFILFVLLVSGVLFEGKVLYDDHNKINSLMDNSTTPGENVTTPDNVTTPGRLSTEKEAEIEQISKYYLQLKANLTELEEKVSLEKQKVNKHLIDIDQNLQKSNISFTFFKHCHPITRSCKIKDLPAATMQDPFSIKRNTCKLVYW